MVEVDNVVVNAMSLGVVRRDGEVRRGITSREAETIISNGMITMKTSKEAVISSKGVPNNDVPVRP